MPTENGEIGTLYIADNDGNYHEFGGIKEINIEPDESVRRIAGVASYIGKSLRRGRFAND